MQTIHIFFDLLIIFYQFNLVKFLFSLSIHMYVSWVHVSRFSITTSVQST